MFTRMTFVLLATIAGCSKPSDSAPQGSNAPPRMRDLIPTVPQRLGTLAPGTGIPVGASIPDVHAVDLDGKDVALRDLVAKDPVLLVFYRGGWCPFCNTEIHDLTQAFPDFTKRGVTIVAVSVDRPDQESKLKAEYTIPFPVLSDADAKVIEAFHVVNRISDEQFARMKSNNVDLESYAGAAHHEIAIPSFFLIDKTGTVRWAHSDPQWQVRPSTAQLLGAIDATFVAKN